VCCRLVVCGHLMVMVSLLVLCCRLVVCGHLMVMVSLLVVCVLSLGRTTLSLQEAASQLLNETEETNKTPIRRQYDAHKTPRVKTRWKTLGEYVVGKTLLCSCVRLI
jgi:hypothetical protein